MQRYFVENFDRHSLLSTIDSDTFTLSEKDSYHIKKVMRQKIGDKIEVVSGKTVFICEIIDLSDQVRCTIVDILDNNNELPVDVTIAQSLIKEQKMDYTLQKSTELGVKVIIPLTVTNSVVKLNEKENKKIQRWQTIVKEASEQSKRNTIPLVSKVFSVNDLLMNEYDIKILCTVNSASTTFKRVLSKVKKNDRMIIVVGPEGGFTKEEEQKLVDNGYIPVSLGNLILRSETVALYVLGIINYYFMR